jgi:hypothetical protein
MHKRGLARRAFCQCALVLALCGCATESIRPGMPREVTGAKINPYEVLEECLQMMPGDWLSYRFDAQRPVVFNIHYHEGQAVIMPVLREGVTSDDDAFRPLLNQEYCLMWQAGREGAVLDYRILLNRGQR